MNFYCFKLNKTVLYYKGGEFMSTSEWIHKPMYHKGDYEIILGLKGKIHLQIEDEPVTVGPNDVLLIPPYTHFRGSKSCTQVDFYWLHFFPQDSLSKFTADENETVSSVITNSDNEKKVILPSQFHLHDYEHITVLMHQILSLHTELSYVEERDFLTSALLIELFKSYIAQHNPSDANSRINYLKEWIRANMSSELTVAEIARQVHLNVDYLTRLFKKYEGITTLQYINHLKIEVATLLLIRTEMPINEVAENSYFSDPKLFMRHFKTEMGLSPTQYRNTFNIIHHNNPHIDPQIPLPKQLSDSIDKIPVNGNE